MLMNGGNAVPDLAGVIVQFSMLFVWNRLSIAAAVSSVVHVEKSSCRVRGYVDLETGQKVPQHKITLFNIIKRNGAKSFTRRGLVLDGRNDDSRSKFLDPPAFSAAR